LIKTGLVGFTSTNGYLVWTGDSSGRRMVVEQNSSGIATNLGYTRFAAYLGPEPTLEALSTGQTDATKVGNMHRRIGIKEMTMVGGTLANQELVSGIASYYGVLLLAYVISDTSGNVGLTFQDEDDAALTGLMGGVATVACVANTINESLEGAVLYKGTDNKALEVDVTHDAGGGGEKVTLGYYYWWET